MGQVDGKIALITGGGSGIGAACAETMAREGARVVITDVDIGAAESVAERIKNANGQAFALQQDVTNEARWTSVVNEIEARFGPLTTMVANAGIAIGRPIFEMTLADWQRQMAVNVDAVFLSVKHCAPSMIKAGRNVSTWMIILESRMASLPPMGIV